MGDTRCMEKEHNDAYVQKMRQRKHLQLKLITKVMTNIINKLTLTAKKISIYVWKIVYRRRIRIETIHRKSH